MFNKIKASTRIEKEKQIESVSIFVKNLNFKKKKKRTHFLHLNNSKYLFYGNLKTTTQAEYLCAKKIFVSTKVFYNGNFFISNSLLFSFPNKLVFWSILKHLCGMIFYY